MLVDDRPLVHLHDSFRCWRPIAQSAVRPDSIVVESLLLDQDLGLSERAKYLTIEKFVAEPGIEALAVSILPRRYGLDVGGLGTDSSDPVPDFLGDEFGWFPQDKQVRQSVHNVGGVEFAIDTEHQRLPGKVVGDVECVVDPSVMYPVLQKVIGPDMVRTLRPKPDT